MNEDIANQIIARARERPLSNQSVFTRGNESLKEGGARNATRGVDPRKEGNKANIGTGQPRYKEWISGGPEGIERE